MTPAAPLREGIPPAALRWRPDVLGAGFESTELPLADTGVATLVRYRPPEPVAAASPCAVLYLHGFNDYFFQADLARWWAGQGVDFFALDLRRYGRSLRPGQTANFCTTLDEYDEELDLAAEAILGAGARRLVLNGHSTGGLIAPLWAARRRGLPIAGLVLNSPFFEFKQPAVVRAVVGPTARAVSRRQPMRSVPGGVDTLYGDSLHASRRGEWDYDLEWKPSPAFPVRLGWLRAVLDGHRTLHAGLGLRTPALVMSSTRTVTVRTWSDELRRGDAVLDGDLIARWAGSVGSHVTIVRIEDGMHDLVLSPRPARDRAYETMETWLRAWVL